MRARRPQIAVEAPWSEIGSIARPLVGHQLTGKGVPALPLNFHKSLEPEFRANPVGEATDRSIRLGRGAGQELEDVLHLRHDLKRHLRA